MRKELWAELGGIDERFDQPGGGLVNLDTFARACELPDSELVILLGEGTFHQVHNGVATNAPIDRHEHNCLQWGTQYREIRGKEYAPPDKPRKLAGPLPAPYLSHLGSEFAQANLKLAAKLEEIAKLKAMVHRANADRDRAQAELDVTLKSRSWWVTKPLRIAHRGLSLLRKRPRD
jgi:hypothetical protein